MCLGGWLKNSFIDFPGTVATVLFFRSCNLRCPYCHNPELVNGTTEPVSIDEVINFLEKRKGVIDGVVLSGGEPTLHSATLTTFVARLRETGVSVKLDTNGLLPGMISCVTPDYLALDLKTLPSRYSELGWRGESCAAVLAQSLSIVRSMEERAEVRITMAGDFIKREEWDRIGELLRGVARVYLQPFHDSGALLDPSFGAAGHVAMEYIEQFRNYLSTITGKCEIRGR